MSKLFEEIVGRLNFHVTNQNLVCFECYMVSFNTLCSVNIGTGLWEASRDVSGHPYYYLFAVCLSVYVNVWLCVALKYFKIPVVCIDFSWQWIWELLLQRVYWMIKLWLHLWVRLSFFFFFPHQKMFSGLFSRLPLGSLRLMVQLQ